MGRRKKVDPELLRQMDAAARILDNLIESSYAGGKIISVEEHEKLEKQYLLENAERLEQERIAKEKEIEEDKKWEIQSAWVTLKAFKPDKLDLAIMEWKREHNDEQFTEEVWPELNKLVRSFAKQYVRNIPQNAKNLLMDCTQTWDHTEWLHEDLMEAIIDWDHNKLGHFASFFKMKCEWNYKTKIRKFNSEYMKGITLTLCRFEEEDEKMLRQVINTDNGDDLIAQQLKDNNKIDSLGRFVMNEVLVEFNKRLNKLDHKLCHLMTLLIENGYHKEYRGSNKYTREQIIKKLDVSERTYMRKMQQIKTEWKNFNEVEK